jgi:serine/threonine protein kinase
MIGSRLAHYEITGHLGTGGMGEVYQATDSKLGRSVAIKLLPEALVQDTERVARLEREARVLASLNHPHIAAIYGLEESGGRKFLVMELVPGETLVERIARGPIPAADALPIATQIAEALEAAHEKGVVHRDLKPANIKVTPNGQVKVLDFGLAKAFSGEAAVVDPSNSPTIDTVVTKLGVILGTAAYMSPEQAKGQAVDHRTDIFAFGCVLYEMLTGRKTFPGEGVSDILASVLKSEPDWDRLPKNATAAIRRVLRRCLRKDQNRRLQTAGDLRIQIEEAGAEPEDLEPCLRTCRTAQAPGFLRGSQQASARPSPARLALCTSAKSRRRPTSHVSKFCGPRTQQTATLSLYLLMAGL